MIPDTTWSWLAALVDGEGSIMLKRKRMKGLVYYYSEVTVVNTHKTLIDEIIRRIGEGKIHLKRNKQHKPVYMWRIKVEAIRRILPRLRPWLVIKGRQADLLSEAMEIAEKCDNRKCTFDQSRSTEYRQRKFEIANEMAILNGGRWVV